jgi:hypothetical protein
VREWAAGIPFRGAWRPSTAPALQGRGGGHGAGAGVAPASRPHGSSRDKAGKGKGEGKGELTGGPHMVVKQGEVKGRRAGWLCWAEMHRRAGGLCRAAGQDGGGLADFY